MLKGVIIFGAGVYLGVYFAQNHQIDKVEDPVQLFNKASNYIKELSDNVGSGDKKK